jgi:hypothetical protein
MANKPPAMSASKILDELRARTSYSYDRRISPAENYFIFQQSISLSNGVEFLSSSNDNSGPIFYLLAVPGLSIDLVKAKKQLEDFNKDVINHLTEIIRKENDLFKLFAIFYDLYRTVEIQQNEYRIGNDKYFGMAAIFEYPAKEIKELRLPILRSNYRGTFLNAFSPIGRYPVDFDSLGTDIKRHLSTLYMLRRRYNMRLQKELNEMKRIFFARKYMGNYYRYTGETSDLVEVAIALVETGKVQKLNTEAVTANDFSRDFCNFLGLHFSKRSTYVPTIHKRVTQNDSFSKKIPGLVKQFLNRIPSK